MDDLLQILIYVAIGLIGIIASVYKNKKMKQQAGGYPRNQRTQGTPTVPRDVVSKPQHDFGPDLGPLMEIFEIPHRPQEKPTYETVEDGPSVEEGGMEVDTAKASSELTGITMENEGKIMEQNITSVQDSFEEGQSDIQKMIAKYNAISKQLGEEDFGEAISAGEIVSVEAEEDIRARKQKMYQFFDARKAIIYSEILKRKEF
jgi:hypothetical protein